MIQRSFSISLKDLSPNNDKPVIYPKCFFQIMSSHQISITFSLTLVLSIVTPATFLIGLLDRSAYAISDFNIDAVGDWGCNSNTQKTVSNIKGKNP